MLVRFNIFSISKYIKTANGREGLEIEIAKANVGTGLN